MKELFRGCILGLAIGDALGFPVEFMNRSEIIKNFGVAGISDFVEHYNYKAGYYSDDTQMTIATAKALIQANLENLDDIMQYTKQEFQIWANSPENNRAPGQSCMDGINNMQEGKHWFSSGDPYSKGCGAAMRVAPIGLVFAHNREKLIEISRANAICTHAHPTGLSSSIAAAASIAYVLQTKWNNNSLDNMIEDLIALLHQKRGIEGFIEHVSYDPLDDQVNKLEQVKKNLKVSPMYAFDILGGGWVGEEAVAGALYCFLRTPNDYCTTVITAANACKMDENAKDHGRCDSDSIACIAGAISGAYNGIDSIPDKWISKIENKDMLFDIADKLYQKHIENNKI